MRHDSTFALPEPADDDDVALFESGPEWFIPGVKPFLGEAHADDEMGLGFRSLLDEPDSLSEAWSRMGSSRSRDGVRSTRRPRASVAR